MKKDEAVAKDGVPGIVGDGFLPVIQGLCRIFGFECNPDGIVINIEILRVEFHGRVEGGVGFGEVSCLRVGGGDETEDANVLGKELAGGFQMSQGFGGAPLLTEELPQKKEVVALREFVALQEGLG